LVDFAISDLEAGSFLVVMEIFFSAKDDNGAATDVQSIMAVNKYMKQIKIMPANKIDRESLQKYVI
jgi:hypothetical protein